MIRFFTSTLFLCLTLKASAFGPHIEKQIRILEQESREEEAAQTVAEMLVDEKDYVTYSKIEEQLPFCGVEKKLLKLLQASRFFIISAGLNAKLENPDTLPKGFIENRYVELHKELVKYGQRFHKTVGRYDGLVENSYIVELPPIDRKLGSKQIDQEVAFITQLGQDFNQDTVIYSSHGNHFMIQTTGPHIGQVIHGRSVFVTATEPDEDNYSTLHMNICPCIGTEKLCRFSPTIENLLVAKKFFTLNFDFDEVHPSFHDWKIHNLATQLYKFNDFSWFNYVEGSAGRVWPRPHSTWEATTKYLIITRGSEEYNTLAKTAMKIKPSEVFVVGTDAHAALIELELTSKGLYFDFRRDIIPEFVRRNLAAVSDLVESKAPIVIYADMNKKIDFFKKYLELAWANGYVPIIVKTIMENHSANLPYMERHVLEFEKWQDDSLQIQDADGNLRLVPQWTQMNFLARLWQGKLSSETEPHYDSE